MEHSSQTKNLVFFKSSASPVPFEMLQVGSSIETRSSGNLNAEWAVLPPSNRVAAMPEEATAKAM